MRRLLYSLLTLMMLGSLFVSCAIDVTPDVQWTALERELGLDQPEIPVLLGYDMPFEDMSTPTTKVSVVGGAEDPTEYVKNLHMVCFTKEGIYLGKRQATLVGDEGIMDHKDGNQQVILSCQGREFFEGTVPARTARIHFVANVTDDNLPLDNQVGSNENMVIKSARMSTQASATASICYWGFHGEASSEAMKAWLAVAHDDGEGNITYTKRDDSNVHLVRDRARLSFGQMVDIYSSTNQIDYKILTIDWILSNGLERGYLAPYNPHNSTDHFKDYFVVDRDPMLDAKRLTPYDLPSQATAARYTAQEYIGGVDQMVRIYDSSVSENNGNSPGPLFLYEDINNSDNPPKIILRVKYQKHRTSQDPSDQVVKYHTLMMLDQNNAPCQILRNHDYILNIYGLPWEGLGYLNFQDAVNSTTYANNMTVTINEKVPEVNNGRFKLSILGDTYIIFQDPALQQTDQYINFSYEAVGAGEDTDDIDHTDFTVEWDGLIYDSFASQTLEVQDVSTGPSIYQGRIKYTLGTDINSALQSGRILLRDNNTGLTRFINIYTITQFNLMPQGATALSLERVQGESRNVNNVSCPTYKMNIRIPGDFPIGLYPIRIRMASTTLNPFKVVRDEGTSSEEVSEDITVLKAGTENGAVLDEETLTNMTFVTTPVTAWNYRKSGEPWDFWYTYTILSKPTKIEDGATVEDKSDKTYTIYFDDVRPLRDAGNRATEVGLYVKIQYFGAPVSATAQ